MFQKLDKKDCTSKIIRTCSWKLKLYKHYLEHGQELQTTCNLILFPEIDQISTINVDDLNQDTNSNTQTTASHWENVSDITLVPGNHVSPPHSDKTCDSQHKSDKNQETDSDCLKAR